MCLTCSCAPGVVCGAGADICRAVLGVVEAVVGAPPVNQGYSRPETSGLAHCLLFLTILIASSPHSN